LIIDKKVNYDNLLITLFKEKNKVKRKITNILLIILLIIIIISLSSGDNTTSSELKSDESVEVPGFEVVFTVIPILAVVCLFFRKRDSRKKDGNKNENNKRGHR